MAKGPAPAPMSEEAPYIPLLKVHKLQRQLVEIAVQEHYRERQKRDLLHAERLRWKIRTKGFEPVC